MVSITSGELGQIEGGSGEGKGGSDVGDSVE